MKKLLVLLMVLGMASMANAALVTSNVTWDVVGTQLIGTGTAMGDVDIALALGAGAYADPTGVIALDATTNGANTRGVMAIAGNNAKINPYSGMLRVLGGDVGEPEDAIQVIGEWYRLDIIGEGTIQLYDVGNNWASLGTIEVPEPMTMSLLGLGGLSLLRRRRA